VVIEDQQITTMRVSVANAGEAAGVNSDMLSLNQESGGPQMPDVGADLVAAEATGCFQGLQAERVMAALELLRHGEITIEQTAGLSGLSQTDLIALLQNLPIKQFQWLAQRTCD
jgi:hypothetical protein